MGVENRSPGRKIACVMFFLAAACFFVVAARDHARAPGWVAVGGVHVAAGFAHVWRLRRDARRERERAASGR